MKSLKSPSDLLSRLHSSEPIALKQPPCAFRAPQPCCQGRGYHIRKKGAFAEGVLCDCVQQCLGCHGKLNHLSDNSAVACQTPSPKAIINIINDSELPARYYQADFASFANLTGNALEQMQVIQRWAKNFEREKKGLLISGPVGVGKTYLLACIIKELATKGIRCQFIDFFQLINAVKGAYSDQKSDQSLLTPLINADVLVVDELGKGRNTEFELTILDQLIMGRYNQDKILVASTNYSLGDMPLRKNMSEYLGDLDDPTKKKDQKFSPEQFGYLEERVESRIFSRLRETTQQVTLMGDDFRRKPS